MYPISYHIKGGRNYHSCYICPNSRHSFDEFEIDLIVETLSFYNLTVITLSSALRIESSTKQGDELKSFVESCIPKTLSKCQLSALNKGVYHESIVHKHIVDDALVINEYPEAVKFITSTLGHMNSFNLASMIRYLEGISTKFDGILKKNERLNMSKLGFKREVHQRSSFRYSALRQMYKSQYPPNTQ